MMCKHVFTRPCIFNQLLIDLRLQTEITLETLEANLIERSRKFLHNPRLRYATSPLSRIKSNKIYNCQINQKILNKNVIKSSPSFSSLSLACPL